MIMRGKVSTHVETVVLLSRKKVDGYMDIQLDIQRKNGKGKWKT